MIIKMSIYAHHMTNFIKKSEVENNWFLIDATNAIVGRHITANAVNTSEIATGAVAALQIAGDAVDGTKIADDSIDSEHYADGSIDTAHIANNAILTQHIDDNQITSAQLADNSVLTQHIDNGQVTADQIGANAVTLAKMASLARGSILLGNSAADVSALAIGSNGYVLKSDGTDIAWAADAVLTTENVQDIAGGMFSSNTESGITATYQDADGTIDLAVSIAGFDTDDLAEGSSNLYFNNSRADTRVALQTGSGPEFFDISVDSGDVINVIYSPGNWDDENSYEIYNELGVMVASEVGSNGNGPSDTYGLISCQSAGSGTINAPCVHNRYPISAQLVTN